MTNIEYQIKCNTLPTWKVLTKILRQSKKALPSTSLSLLTGLHQVKIDQTLESLQKHGIVRKVTQKSVSYWKFIGDDDGKNT